MNPKVSVVVPVYKVEKYIERCARSLFEQTLQEMEFIFVDDCTPDNSVDIIHRVLNEYPHRISQTKFLHNEKNRGQLQTRCYGFMNAEGDFIGTVDSDDWIEPNAYESLYNQACNDEADCVLFGYHRDFATYSESCIRKFPFTTGEELVENCYKFPFEFFMWGSLVKNEERLLAILNRYYNNPDWEGITMWEDVLVMLPYYFGTKKISYSGQCFYHYNMANEGSTVNTQNEKKVYQALKVIDYLRKELFVPELDMTFHCLAFGAKGALLGIKGIKAWRTEHRDANKHIMKFTSIPLKVRLFFFMLSHGLSFPYYCAIVFAKWKKK